MSGRAHDGGASEPIASVVVPAHNEEALIGHLLAALRAGGDASPVEIVVACNACQDATASVARQFGARVVELDQASKVAALNAGDEAATAFPRFYVDADVVLTARAVLDVAQALSRPGALCAAPPLAVDVDGRPWAVRRWYAMWLATPYMLDHHVGSGVYALSAAGRQRFDRFPDLLADDLFVRELFTRSERTVVDTQPFTVQAPRTLRSLARRRVRIHAGNLQLATAPGLPPRPGADETVAAWWRPVVRRPALAPAALCYAAVNLGAKLAARRRVRRNRSLEWTRDDTTRVASPAPPSPSPAAGARS